MKQFESAVLSALKTVGIEVLVNGFDGATTYRWASDSSVIAHTAKGTKNLNWHFNALHRTTSTLQKTLIDLDHLISTSPKTTRNDVEPYVNRALKYARVFWSDGAYVSGSVLAAYVVGTNLYWVVERTEPIAAAVISLHHTMNVFFSSKEEVVKMDSTKNLLDKAAGRGSFCSHRCCSGKDEGRERRC